MKLHLPKALVTALAAVAVAAAPFATTVATGTFVAAAMTATQAQAELVYGWDADAGAPTVTDTETGVTTVITYGYINNGDASRGAIDKPANGSYTDGANVNINYKTAGNLGSPTINWGTDAIKFSTDTITVNGAEAGNGLTHLNPEDTVTATHLSNKIEGNGAITAGSVWLASGCYRFSEATKLSGVAGPIYAVGGQLNLYSGIRLEKQLYLGAGNYNADGNAAKAALRLDGNSTAVNVTLVQDAGVFVASANTGTITNLNLAGHTFKNQGWGTLNLTNVNAAGGGAIDLADGQTVTANNVSLGTGTLTKVGAGTLKINDSITGTGGIVMTGGTIELKSNNIHSLGSLTLGGNSTFISYNAASANDDGSHLTIGSLTLTGNATIKTHTGSNYRSRILINSLAKTATGDVTLTLDDNHQATGAPSSIHFADDGAVGATMGGTIDIKQSQGSSDRHFAVILGEADGLANTKIQVSQVASSDGWVKVGIGSGSVSTVEIAGIDSSTVSNPVHLVSFTGGIGNDLGNDTASAGGHTLVIRGAGAYVFNGTVGATLKFEMNGTGSQSIKSLGANGEVLAKQGNFIITESYTGASNKLTTQGSGTITFGNNAVIALDNLTAGASSTSGVTVDGFMQGLYTLTGASNNIQFSNANAVKVSYNGLRETASYAGGVLTVDGSVYNLVTTDGKSYADIVTAAGSKTVTGINIAQNSKLTGYNDGTTGLAAPITGNGEVHIGGGTLTFSNAANADHANAFKNLDGFTGTLVVDNGGILASGTANGQQAIVGALGRGFTLRNIIVNGGGTLKLQASDSLGWSNTQTPSITLNGDDTNGAAIMEVTGKQTLSTHINLNGNTEIKNISNGALESFGGKITVTGSNNINRAQLMMRNDLEVEVTGADDVFEQKGDFDNTTNTGSGSMTKTGAGKMIISGAYTTTHGVTVSAGTLELAAGVQMNDANSKIAVNGGTLSLLGTAAEDNQSLARVSTLASGAKVTGTGKLVVAAAPAEGETVAVTEVGTQLREFDGTVFVGSNQALKATAGAANGFVRNAVEVTAGGTLILNVSDSIGYGNTATKTITLQGDSEDAHATMTINALQTLNTNVYLKGHTTIDGSASIASNGGTLTVTGTDNVMAGTLATRKQLVIDVQGEDSTFTVTGALKNHTYVEISSTPAGGDFRKTGSGTMIIADGATFDLGPLASGALANNFARTLTVAEGTLQLAAGVQQQSGGSLQITGGTLDLQGTLADTDQSKAIVSSIGANGLVTGTGLLVLDPGAGNTMAIGTQLNGFGGTLAVNNGTVSLGGTGATLSLVDAITLNNSSSLSILDGTLIDLSNWRRTSDATHDSIYHIGAGLDLGNVQWSVDGGTYDSETGLYSIATIYHVTKGSLTWGSGSTDTFDDVAIAENNTEAPVSFEADLTAVTLTSDVTAASVVVQSGKSMSLAGGHKLTAGGITLRGDLIVKNSDNTLAGAIVTDGTGKLVLDWNGRKNGWDVSGITSYGGELQINSGTSYLMTGGGTGLFSSITVQEGGQLGVEDNITANVTLQGTGNGVAGRTADEQSALKFNPGKTLTGNVTLTGESARVSIWGAGTANITGDVIGRETNGSKLTFTHASGIENNPDMALNIGGKLTDINEVEVVSSAGKVNVTGGLTYAGDFTKSGAGELKLAGEVAVDSVALSAGKLTYAGTGLDNKTISGAGNLNVAADLSVGAHLQNITGTVTVKDGATLTSSHGGGTGFVKGDVVVEAGGTLVLTATDAFGYNTPTSSLTMGGGTETATLTLSNRQTMATSMTLNGNTYIGKAEGAAADTAFEAFGTTITATGTNNEMAVGIMTHGSHEITVDVTGASDTLLISAGFQKRGTGVVHKTGAGNLSLTADAAAGFDSSLKLEGGSLTLSGAGTIGNGHLYIGAGLTTSMGADGTGTYTLNNSHLHTMVNGDATVSTIAGTLQLDGGAITFDKTADNTLISLGATSLTVSGNETVTTLNLSGDVLGGFATGAENRLLLIGTTNSAAGLAIDNRLLLGVDASAYLSNRELQYSFEAAEGGLYLVATQAGAYTWDAAWKLTSEANAPAAIAGRTLAATGRTIVSELPDNKILISGGGGNDAIVEGGKYRQASSGDSWIAMEDGTAGLIIGGNHLAWDDSALNNNPHFNGSSHIQISGGTVGYVIGGNHEDNGVPQFKGSSYITIEDGVTVTGSVIGGSTSAHTKGLIFGREGQSDSSNIFIYTVLASGNVVLDKDTPNAVIGANAHLTNTLGGNAMKFYGDSNITVNITNAAENSEFGKLIIGGNYQGEGGDNPASNGSALHSGDTHVSISDASGNVTFTQKIIGGDWSKLTSTMTGDTHVTINSGKVTGDIIGGSYVTDYRRDNAYTGNATIDGTANVTVEGGTVANIYGGNYATGGRATVGDVTVELNGGEITGDVYAAGKNTGNATMTTGDTTVNLKSGVTFGAGDHIVSGGYDGSGTVGTKTLDFTSADGNYTNTANVAFQDFDVVDAHDDTVAFKRIATANATLTAREGGTIGKLTIDSTHITGSTSGDGSDLKALGEMTKLNIAFAASAEVAISNVTMYDVQMTHGTVTFGDNVTAVATTGTIEPPVQAGGARSAGNNTLTLDTVVSGSTVDGTLKVDINSGLLQPGTDLVWKILDHVTVADGGFTLELGDTLGYLLNHGHTATIEWTGMSVDPVIITADNMGNISTATGGLIAGFTSGDLTLSMENIPEPTTGALSMLALAALAARRRRK